MLRLAFYWLRQREFTLSQLLQSASSLSGIYGSHLRQQTELLQQSPDLAEVFQQVIAAPDGVCLDTFAAYRLERLGLVKLQGNQVVLSCELYRLYFGT